MIQTIHLKNFTIIDELTLDFNTGMIALTGETGAGKSIIIDAIKLALGARLNSQVVRENTEKADIVIIFSLKNNTTAFNWLNEHELESGEECILRRTISREGRSRAFINGSPATLQLLNELGSLLVSIHGQHEHQYLVKKHKQRQLIDAYGQHGESLEKIAEIYKSWKKINTLYQETKSLYQNQHGRQEFLQYQLTEFTKLNLTEGEVETLNQEYKQLTNAKSLLHSCQQALTLLNHDEHSIESLLSHSIQYLQNIIAIDPKIEMADNLLKEALIIIREASDELNRYFDGVVINPERLNEVENRIATIHDLARKHHVSSQALWSIEQQLQDELEILNEADSTLEKLKKQMHDLELSYQSNALQLSLQRQKSAKKLETLVTQDINNLGMVDGKLIIRFSQIENTSPSPFGLDQVEFLVSANPGQSPQPLAKVASGGELSRISLAIQVNTIKVVQPPSLIFDEVDSGIGGSIAEMIGLLLRKLGESTQVFCITHLPQVASLAHNHYQVKKHKSKNSTKTEVVKLSLTARVEEIARMLGGIKITEQTTEHAKQMLEKTIKAASQ